MMIVKYPVDLSDTYPLERIGALRDLSFLNVETTGFSGDTSQFYLIGCICHDNSGWRSVQWFTDTRGSEIQLLTTFFMFMKRLKVLMRFNGDGFGIPYLSKCCRQLGPDYNFDNITSVDIYKRIKPYRKLLGPENMKQKSVKQFLGVSREDKHSGGQLTEIYRDHLVTHESLLYDLLILHNESDLKGIPPVLSILNYADAMEAPFALNSQRLCYADDIPGPFLNLTWKSPYSIPVPLEHDTVPVSLELHWGVLTCNIVLYQDELKYFYPSYRGYRYLPSEDTAIHKSVGEYADKDARKKTTAHICYPKKCGLFLPQFGPLQSSCLRGDYKAPLGYAAYFPDLLSDPDSADSYARQVLDYISYKWEVQVPFSKRP